MKSAYYAAVVTNAYRHALDAVACGDVVPEVWVKETEMVSHRPYCTGFYLGGEPGQCYDGTYETGADIVAVVESCDVDENAVLTQRNKFLPADEPIRFIVTEMTDAEGETIPDARHPMMEVHLRLPKEAPKFSILRKRRI